MMEFNLRIKDVRQFLARSDGSLAQKATRGGIWVFSLKATSSILGFIRTIVLARLLSPNDFGLMGITVLAISTLEIFSQTGFTKALVQKKENVKPYLNSAWLVQAIRGLLLFLTLFLCAPLVSKFYDEPQIVTLIRVVSFVPLLKGLTNIGVVYFQKELDFKKRFIYQLSGFLADFGIVIPAALILRNVWALVLGLLTGSIIKLISSYRLSSYRPNFQFNLRKSLSLFNFGKYVFAQGVVLFIIARGDDALVGKVIGIASLGLYQMAYTVSNLPVSEITSAISEVAFPVYSKLQDNRRRLREALKEVLGITVFITLPLSGGIFVLAPEFIKVFLGERWLSMVPALRVLTVFGFTQAIGTTFSPIYYALTKVSTILKINIIQLVFLAVSIYPLSLYWGILGTAVATTLSGIIYFYLSSKKIMGVLKINGISLFKPVFPAVIASAAMVAFVWLLKSLILNSVNYFWIFFLVSTGAVSYAVFIYAVLKIFNYSSDFLTKALKVRGSHPANL